MKEFLYLFRGGDAREANLSEEANKAHMEKWGAWMQGLQKSGNFVAGQPLQNEGKVVENQGNNFTDGPFAEGKEIVNGYLIVKASNLEEASELSKSCPILEHDGTVEIREIAPMG